MSTINYLHTEKVQISFEASTDPDYADKMCVSFLPLDGSWGTETRIVSIAEARAIYKQLRETGAVKGEANRTFNAAPIKAKLDTAAANGVKSPKMLVEGFCFTRAKNTSKNPGCIYVKAGKEWEATYYGKITPEGAFIPSNECTQSVIDALAAIADDVVGAAKAYGRRHGCCSFCSRELTNHVSIALSYGPICAEKYGMPHDYNDRSVVPSNEPAEQPAPQLVALN